jgi:predicted GNAT family N-acyltransferase
VNISIKLTDFTTDFAVIEQIRYTVFQLEQLISAEDEFDGKDAESIHLLAYIDSQPLGTLRIRNIGQGIVKIERLAVLKAWRSQGVGKQMMEEAISYLQQLGTYKAIKIHAQAHLEKFYTNLGFQAQGESFIEAGIEHLLMLKQVILRQV